MPKKKIVKRKSKSLKRKSSGMIKSYAPSGVDLDLDQLYDIIDELEIEEYDKDIAKHHARIDAMKAQEYDFYKDTGQLHLLSYGGKNRYSPPQSYITDKVTADWRAEKTAELMSDIDKIFWWGVFSVSITSMAWVVLIWGLWP